MNRTPRSHVEALLSTALLLLAALALVASPAGAQRTQFLSDGAVQNGGDWELPMQGSCTTDSTKATRPDCLSLRLVAATTAECTALAGSWTTSVCNDLVNNANRSDCEAQPGRFWNDGTGVCAVTLEGYDRNNVQCTLLGGTWVTYTSPAGACTGAWTMPSRDLYDPPFLTSGTGDYCLRCHNSQTQYNGPRLRDVEGYLLTGHKNVLKPVNGQPQGPPHAVTPYPTDEAGNPINWATGKITVGGTDYDLFWLVNNWMAPLGRAVWNGAGTNTYGSCSRCHTTNWKTEPTLNLAKQPAATFPTVVDTVANLLDSNVWTPSGTDPNNFVSWDGWGIGCTRCHASAVNVTGGAGPFTAPAGMSSHHNNLTPPTYPSSSGNYGYCTDPRFTTKAACESSLDVGPLSPGYLAQWVTPCSDNNFATQATCEGAGATWTPLATAGCNVAGVCGIGGVPDPTKADSAACAAAGGSWAAATDIIRCEDIAHYGKEHGVAAYAAARFTGNFTQRGQVITALCLNCHRSDASGNPREPSAGLIAGNSHGQLGLVGHAVGQAYLNSPHAKYTGTFAGIATGKFKYDGSGEYRSHFMADGEAANTGNGCTGCHDVHQSIVHDANPAGGAIREHCTECHTKAEPAMQHPTGPGTPFEHGLEESCMACHMPMPLVHLWRINVDPEYRTFPVAAVDANVAANTAPDGNYTQAVWNDVDLACGKCHGGGVSQVTTTIVSNAGAVLTVANAAGFDKAAKIVIPAAGGLQNDGTTRGDFEGTIKTVNTATNQITLLGAANLANVGGRSLTQNYTLNGAGYMTKLQLAALAAGMHADKPLVRFRILVDVDNSLMVRVNANASTCSGSNANCNAFAWEWGDGTPNGSGAITTHTYASPGTYDIRLTVKEYAVGEASLTKSVTVVGNRPELGGTCSFDPDTWTATVTDSSTAPNGIRQVVVNWGDASVVSVDKTAPFGPFVHTYLVAKPAPGFTLTKKVVDGTGQQTVATLVCTPAVIPAFFQVAGTVLDPLGGALTGAKVQVKRGEQAVGTTYSAPGTGAFAVGYLKPGTYTLVVSKTGFVFPAPITLVVGPSSAGNIVQATSGP